MSNFTKEPNEFDLLHDRSLVIVTVEKPEIAAFKSLGISIFNNMFMTCFRFITTINLILLGHILYEEKVHYKLFMTFQIGVFILEFLGKYFLIGLIKYIFGENKDMKSLYNLYIKLKTALFFLIPFIIIPVSVSSYYILKLIFKYALHMEDSGLISEVYKKYLLPAVLMYFFEILFLLNLQFLYKMKKLKLVFTYMILFLVCHAVLSWMLLFILNFEIFGITISYCFNSLLFFFFSDRKIYRMVAGDAENFFYIIPNRNNFEWEILTNLKTISYYSLINLGEVFIYQFVFLASLFIDNNQLIVNIIYLNFFELIIEINRGFYYTIKREIDSKYQDANDRQTYVQFFFLYYLILSLIIFVTLLLFKNILLNIYLLQGGETILKQIAGGLRIIYSLCILFMGVKIILNGIARGINVQIPNERKVVYIFLFMFFCYLFSFFYDLGIFGLWLSMLILDILHIIENAKKSRSFFYFGSRR